MQLPPASAHLAATPFAPRARRTMQLLGASVELVWLPERAARPGRPVADRPALRPDLAERIVAEEALWRGADTVLTPNRYPFAGAQGILWAATPTREHSAALLATLCAWNDRERGTALVNTIGAAASIARAHGHITTETRPFLADLPERRAHVDFLPAVADVTWLAKDLPVCLLGARGPAAARAHAIAALQVHRMTAAMNLVDQGGTTWFFPRSAVETPAPWFPYALGAAEVWGRWCYADEDAFARATAADLEQALVAAGCRPLG